MNKYLKISVISFSIVIISAIVLFIFGLLPIYGTVSGDVQSDASNVINRSQIIINTCNILIGIGIVTSFITLILGVVKYDSKSKK